MNKKERKEWIKNQPGRTMTAEEFAEVQGMTHAEFRTPTKLKTFTIKQIRITMKTFKELIQQIAESKLHSEAVAVELASEKITISNKHDISLGKFSKEGIAVIEQKGAKNKWQVVFEADGDDGAEFGTKGGAVLCRLQTPLSKPGSFEHRTICAIDPVKGTIAFLNMDKYEDDGTVKWERGIKFTFLNILDSKLSYFELK